MEFPLKPAGIGAFDGLLCAVRLEDILTMDKQGNIYLGGEKLDVTVARNLKEEAIFLGESQLWKLLTNTLRDQAQKVMFEQSTSYDDMRNGKMMLYNINVQEKIIAMLKAVPSVAEEKKEV